MHTVIPLKSTVSYRIHFMHKFFPLLILAGILIAAQMLNSQAPAPAAPAFPAHQSTSPHKHSVKVKTKKHPQVIETVAPVAAPAPELPKWPANEKPVAARVTWDSHGLRIEAANSSLSQILEDVAAATGTQVQGFETDQRIFGVFGPGPAREVLSQLMLGSGYNVVMVGDLGQGTPREIQLTLRHRETAKAAPNNATPSDDDADSDDQPQPVGRPGFGPGGQPNVPQQMQQRSIPEQPPNNPPF